MFLLRNPRILLALVQTLVTCVFHLKSLVIVTPRYLMLSTSSRSVPSKVYEVWIFLIRFLVSCIILRLTDWNLITPLPCPGTQSISILLKFHCVFFILNFTIANTVISKKSYFRLNIWYVIYVQRKQEGTKNGALGDTQKKKRSPVRFYSIYNNSLLSETKKRISISVSCHRFHN